MLILFLIKLLLVVETYFHQPFDYKIDPNKYQEQEVYLNSQQLALLHNIAHIPVYWRYYIFPIFESSGFMDYFSGRNTIVFQIAKITSMLSPLKAWLNQPFTLLDKKRDQLVLVFCVGLFGFFFLYLYNPFNLTRWFAGGDWEHFLIFLKFSLLAVCTLLLMELGVRPVLKLRQFTHLTFLLFVLGELLVFSLLMFFLFEYITSLPAGGFEDFMDIIRYTALILIIPYASVLFYFHYQQTLAKLPSIANHLLQIRDENDKLQLAIDQDQVLALFAADNYVTVCYSKEGKVAKELVRTSLKKLEAELSNTAVLRCSRSAMVNVKNIRAFKTVNRQLTLEIENMPDTPVAVSRNYKSRVTAVLSGTGTFE